MTKKNKVKEKKKMILEAMKTCLEKNVYSQISIEKIAKEAGLSKGGLRHYYPSKEALYMGLIEDFFSRIQMDQKEIIRDLSGKDKVFVSTMFGIERFMLDKKNIRIFINLILYGFEDEKIMRPIQMFLQAHMNVFAEIIMEYRKEKGSTYHTDEKFLARISQILLLCSGIFESIDPQKVDIMSLIEYIQDQLKQ